MRPVILALIGAALLPFATASVSGGMLAGRVYGDTGSQYLISAAGYAKVKTASIRARAKAWAVQMNRTTCALRERALEKLRLPCLQQMRSGTAAVEETCGLRFVDSFLLGK
ncbi:MAG: hypothetical protein FJW20_24600 [Acidimicrobiia bacterium]|nr:hypothetical protein [Acidimicrobiia bacterium]